MSFIDDIVNSVKAELYDRSVSPLMGSFNISWLLWNYKFILIVFANIEIEKKIQYLDNYYSASDTLITLYWLILPITTTIFYIFVYPEFATPVFKHARNKQRVIKEIKTQIEDETPLTKEEAREIRRQLALLQIEHEKDLERKDSEIEGLKTEVKRHKSSAEKYSFISQAKASAEEIVKEAHTPKDTEILSAKEVEILNILETEIMSVSELLQQFKNDKIKTKHLLFELLKKGYIDSDGGYIKNSQLGIAYLAKHLA